MFIIFGDRTNTSNGVYYLHEKRKATRTSICLNYQRGGTFFAMNELKGMHNVMISSYHPQILAISVSLIMSPNALKIAMRSMKTSYP
jgi:hypothetical protein